MQEKGLEFHYYPMDDQKEALDQIKKEHEHKTVPLITEKVFDGWKLIGGYDDLVKHIRQQENKKSD